MSEKRLRRVQVVNSDEREGEESAPDPAEITVRRDGIGSIVIPRHPVYDEDALDPGSHLTAELARIRADDRVLVAHGLSGLLPVVAARLAPNGHVEVWATMRSEEAQVRRALAANGIDERIVTVHRSSDLSYLRGREFDVALAGCGGEAVNAAILTTIRQGSLLLRDGGLLYLSGGKREGVMTAAKSLDEIIGGSVVIAYRKGHRLIESTRGASVRADWSVEDDLIVDYKVRDVDVSLGYRPGVFGARGLDDGTAMLLRALEVPAGGTVLDLGCGTAVVGITARLLGAGTIAVADDSVAAVELAERNLLRNGIADAIAICSDGVEEIAGRQFDVVAINPPFHVGRVQTTAVAERLIAESARVLRPSGRLYVVANRFLPYERVIRRVFGMVTTVVADQRYKVLSAELGAGSAHSRATSSQ